MTENVSKGQMLKKAGLSPVMTVIVLLMSSPGFYQTFFDRGTDEANKKAEVAYEVLVNEVKHLREDDQRLRRELGHIRQILLIRGEISVSSFGGGVSNSMVGLMHKDSDMEIKEDDDVNVEGEDKLSSRKQDTDTDKSKQDDSSGDNFTVSRELLESELSLDREDLPSLEEAVEQNILK